MARKLRGNTTIGMVNAGEAERASFKPIGTSITTTPAIGQSYSKMMGGMEGIGSSGGYGSMSGLEAASMRLADAAAKRSMAETEFASESKFKEAAKMGGYSSPYEMQSDIRRKRLESERESEDQKKIAQGYKKVGGKWYLPSGTR